MAAIYRLLVEFQPDVTPGDQDRVELVQSEIDKHAGHGAKILAIRSLLDEVIAVRRKKKANLLNSIDHFE